MRMIRLTRVNESECWIDADQVIGMERHREGALVYVGPTSFAVKEAPEAILSQLRPPDPVDPFDRSPYPRAYPG